MHPYVHGCVANDITLGTLRFDVVGGDAVCDLIVDEDIRGG